MKIKMKKLFMVLLCVSVWAMNFAALGKCESQPILETEDFTYEILGSDEEEKYVTITGLTEEGQTKEVLVVPETIEGYPVKRLWKPTLFLGDLAVWESDKLTALYLHDYMYAEMEFHCPHVQVFMLDVIIEEDRKSYIGNRIPCVYVSFIEYSARYGDRQPYIVRPANISYRYNYDNAPNYGYYWIDNHLINGEKITYIPEEPTREGYKFDGWYHEPECITAWDFESDTATVYEYEEYTQETFYENVLYAKWLEI